MARYRFDVYKHSWSWANGKRLLKELDHASVHISAPKMAIAWEKFEKQHPVNEEEAIRNNWIYTFDCCTDNIKKEKPNDAKQKAKSGNNKRAKRSKA